MTAVGLLPIAVAGIDVDALMKGAQEDACEKIYAYCQENAEERGRPVAVIAVDRLPLTPMGKVDNKLLEEEYRHFDYTARGLS